MSAIAAVRPLVFTTATNDGAFWPAPQTAVHEYGCFKGAVGEATEPPENNKQNLAFVQFSEAVCTEDGNREPLVDDAGHDCITKRLEDGQAPEFELAIKAMKLYAQLGGDETSQCYSMIYGEGDNSLKMSNTTDVLDIRVV